MYVGTLVDVQIWSMHLSCSVRFCDPEPAPSFGQDRQASKTHYCRISIYNQVYFNTAEFQPWTLSAGFLRKRLSRLAIRHFGQVSGISEATPMKKSGCPNDKVQVNGLDKKMKRLQIDNNGNFMFLIACQRSFIVK